MSVIIIDKCENIMMKPVKMFFILIPKIWGFKKSTAFVSGFRIH